MAAIRCGAIWLDERSGQKVQCEGLRGHRSAHYSEDQWWPNHRGFPDNISPQFPWVGLIMLAVMMGAIGAAIYFYITR